jgi:HlyD family secretion protein
MRNIIITATLLSVATSLLAQTADRASLWQDTVKRGEMIRQIRGLGEVTGPRTAVLRIAETQIQELRNGQPVSLDARGEQMLAGVVDSIEKSASNGVIAVHVALGRPSGLPAGTQVDGLVEIGRLNDVVTVARPAMGRAQTETELFKVDPDGAHATRVRVQFGRSSVNTIEVLQGLQPGDRVIVSDTRAFDRYQRIELR